MESMKLVMNKRCLIGKLLFYYSYVILVAHTVKFASGAEAEKPAKKQPDGLNTMTENGKPVQRNNICRFGVRVKDTCKCKGVTLTEKESEPICGSDIENYANYCEFKRAKECNPRLVPYPGPCPADGGPPRRPRLNYTKKNRVEENDEDIADYDLEDPMAFNKRALHSRMPRLPRLPGQLSRGLGGSGTSSWWDQGMPWDDFL